MLKICGEMEEEKKTNHAHVTALKGVGYFRSSQVFINGVPLLLRNRLIKMSGNNVEEKVNHASNSKGISLPMTRVKLIMKSSPDVSSINQEALLITTKATVR